MIKINNKHHIYVMCLIALLSVAQISAQVTGSVFRDYNGDGTKQAGEPLISGVTVNLYNSSNGLCATTTTSGTTAPNYSVIGSCSGPLRVEFVLPSSNTNPAGPNSTIDFSALGGFTYGSSVQFLSSSTGTADFAINSPQDFAISNPRLITSEYINGDGQVSGSSAATSSVIRAFNYNDAANTGSPAASVVLGNASNVGSVAGSAFHRQSNKVFWATFVKRHASFGPLGINGIYVTSNATAASGSTSTGNFVNLNSINPAFNAGTVTRNFNPGGGDAFQGNHDQFVFDSVGKIGMGDLELSDNEQYLYVLNLNDRRIWRVEVGATGVAPTSSSQIVSYPAFPNPCTNSTFRPFGMKSYRGFLYIGGVCDGVQPGGGSVSRNNLKATIYKVDLSVAPGSATFTLVYEFPLTYNRDANLNRGEGGGLAAEDYEDPNGVNTSLSNTSWHPWARTFSEVQYANSTRPMNPQPMLFDIEFDVEGTMVLSFVDRTGHQLGNNNYGTVVGNFTDYYCTAQGDVLRVYNNNGTYELERNGKEGPSSPKAATAGAGNGDGPSTLSGTTWSGTAGEFYYQDRFDFAVGGALGVGSDPANHDETSSGGLAILPGKNEILVACMDPIASYNVGGVRYYDNTTGEAKKGIIVSADINLARFGKAAGLGDIELLSTISPMEVGNRVWRDNNNDGIQTAGEPGIGGVVLELLTSGGAAVDGDTTVSGVQSTFVTTNANGNWYLSSASGTDATGVNYKVNLLPNTSYIVRLATSGTGNDWDPTANGGLGGPRSGSDLDGLQLAQINVSGTGAADQSDNDASLVSSIPQIAFTTGAFGANNHSLDLGFEPTPINNSLGDKVWRDDDNDGTQDAGEPGVSSITVNLYNNGTDGNPGTVDDILVGTTKTDAYGNYLFNNLSNGNYNVLFTLPSNYKFTSTTGSNDTDPSNSDASTTTGRTGTVVLSGGENELDLDAGIIFPQESILPTVGDRVWLDLNNNGTQDPSEIGVSGVAVELLNSSGAVVNSTLTDYNGNYLFYDVTPASNYTVRFVLPNGMIFTTKSGAISGSTNSDANTSVGATFGQSDPFNVVLNDNIRYVDAGIVPQNLGKASLGDFVWEDLDRDGIQDAGEPGISGITVRLLNGSGTVLQTTKTDVYGYYNFNNLDPADYIVEFVKPSTYTFSTADAGDDAFDSDANTTTGRTGKHSVPAGARVNTLDAGMYFTSTAGSLATLGNYVWFDYNRDGQQNNGEYGLAGAKLTLLDANGAVYDYDPITSGVQPYSTYTNNTGFYNFVNLVPGTYKVKIENIPTGYSLTAADLGGLEPLDSDADPGTGYSSSVTLVAGQNYIDLDFGLLQGVPSGKGSLGNRVWYDLNNNGIQDANESGVSGVLVTLKSCGVDGVQGNGDDVTYSSTVTNSIGEYIFTDLSGEKYYVEWSNLPAGFVTVAKNLGANDALDSDGNPISGGISRSETLSLAQGEDNLTLDLGIFKANINTLGNFVWFDLNADGLQTTGEPGVPGVMVTLMTSAGTTYDANTTLAGVQPYVTTTNSNGFYQFTDIPDGDYRVLFTNLPAGFTFTAANTGGNDDLDSDPNTTTGLTTLPNTVNSTTPVSSPRSDQSVDAGITTVRAALGNFVWEDKNGNGIQDSGEPGIPGVTVTLYDNTGVTALATAITDGSGMYFFPNLTPGTYVVGFTTIPDNMEFTLQDATTESLGTDSDPNVSTGKTSTITLVAGEVNLNIDAGVRQKITSAVGDYVWFDKDANGIQLATESPISGVVAILYNSSGTAIGSSVTNGNGYYLISNVTPGSNYYISFINSPAGDFTLQNIGGTSALNNSKANTSGTTTTFNVGSGVTIVNIDAGIYNLIPLPSPLKLGLTCEVGKNQTVVLKWNAIANNTVAAYRIVELGTSGNKLVATLNVNPVSKAYTYTITNFNGGVYSVIAVDANGLELVSSQSNCTSINQGAFKLYPNPTQNTLTVNLPEFVSEKVKIQVFTVTGKQVWSREYSSTSTDINLSVDTFVDGVYLLKVSDGNVVLTKQFIVKK